MYPGPEPLRFDGKLIRIDIDPEQLVRGFPADVPIFGDSRPGAARAVGGTARSGAARRGRSRAKALRDALPALWWPAVRTHRALSGRGAEALCPMRSWSAIRREPVYAGNQFFAPDSTALMVQLEHRLRHAGLRPAGGDRGEAGADPGRPVVALVGDGGLQYSLPELASAVESRVPVVVLVWNNRAYGEIRNYMVDSGIAPIGVELHTPDLVAVARGYGCAAERASNPDHLAALLAEAGGHAGPSLIEVVAEPPFTAG